MVVVARQTRRRTHPPEQCYTGGGYRLTASNVRRIRLNDGQSLSVREIILRKGGHRRIVWYFYKSGPRYRTSYWLHQAGVALRKLYNPDTSDALVKADVAVPAGEIASGRRTLKDFYGAAMASIRQHVP